MVKRGMLVICDRCGKEVFVEETEVGRVEQILGKHLCPSCTDLYRNMVNVFFAPEVKRPINLED